MNFIRLIFACLFFGSAVGAGFAAFKVWRYWARRTSAAMFFALVLTGIAVGSFLRLWASIYLVGQPIEPIPALLSVLGILAESVPVILTAMYLLGVIRGRWLKGQNGGTVGE